MAEKIRPLHLPPTSSPSQQQPLLMPSSPSDGGGGIGGGIGGGGGGGGGVQHGMQVPKLQPQQVPSGHHPSSQPLPQGGSGQPDIALHARPPSSSGPGTMGTPAHWIYQNLSPNLLGEYLGTCLFITM